MSGRLFILKLLLFISPLLFVIGIYIANDPFKVIYHYNNFYPPNQFCAPNRDYASTEVFLNTYGWNNYNSFIFGNSRSLSYSSPSWQKYIDSSSKVFHFDASAESLYGINQKIKLLSRKGIKIKNALFVIDRDVLANTTNSVGHLFVKHPALSGQSQFSFQLDFFKTFIDYKFLTSYLDYKLTGKKNRFFEDVTNETVYTCDTANNDMKRPVLDSMLIADSSAYYKLHNKYFPSRQSKESIMAPVIKAEQKIMLTEISQIFDKDSTNYKIIISPLYYQEKLNPVDLKYLKSLFGEYNVFDFSGKNAITDDIHNYYEESHYRPHVADYIMQTIYLRNDTTLH